MQFVFTSALALLRSFAPREDDPMGWWLEHSKHFPVLGKLAKKYLCTGPPREIWGPGAKFDMRALEILSCSTTKR